MTQDRKIDLKDLLSSKRTREISDTRAIISYLAAIELRNSGTKIASQLRLSEKSVSRCIDRGKKLLGNDKKLIDYLQYDQKVTTSPITAYENTLALPIYPELTVEQQEYVVDSIREYFR